MLSSHARLGGILTLTLTAACAPKAKEPEQPKLTELSGQCSDLYGGKVCTWAEMDGDRVATLGATIPLASIEGAPSEAEMVWPPVAAGELMLPEAAQRATGLNHLTIFWEPHGHPPGAFMTPHFDFHFYSIAPAERTAIDCSDLSKPATLADGYDLPDPDVPGIGKLVGLCVPKMGMHSLDKAMYTETGPLGASMVLGYYRGNVIFTEPMIGRDYLLKRQHFTVSMPTVTTPSGVRYPTTFRATYDSTAQAYRFVFAGFGS